MKRLVLLIVTIFLVLHVFAQKKKNSLDYIETSTGWTINLGDTVQLGTGSLPKGIFKYVTNASATKAIEIKQNGSTINTDPALEDNYKFRKLKVLQIPNTQTLVVKNGLAGRLSIDVEPAIASGELIKPKQKKEIVVVNQGSTADELAKIKKLYDEGVLTKEEYEAQKKKLLEK